MNMIYFKGYRDALFDLQRWIDCTSEEFFKSLKINKKALKMMFGIIVQHENKFMVEKENFAIRVFIPRDKKQKIKMKHTLSEDEISEAC